MDTELFTWLSSCFCLYSKCWVLSFRCFGFSNHWIPCTCRQLLSLKTMVENAVIFTCVVTELCLSPFWKIRRTASLRIVQTFCMLPTSSFKSSVPCSPRNNFMDSNAIQYLAISFPVSRKSICSQLIQCPGNSWLSWTQLNKLNYSISLRLMD